MPPARDPDPPPADYMAHARAHESAGSTEPAILERARRLWATRSVEHLGEGRATLTVDDADRVADRVATSMGDVANAPWYRHLCRAVLADTLPSEVLALALHELFMRQSDPSMAIKNPGAYFVDVLDTGVQRWNEVPPSKARPATLGK